MYRACSTNLGTGGERGGREGGKVGGTECGEGNGGGDLWWRVSVAGVVKMHTQACSQLS